MAGCDERHGSSVGAFCRECWGRKIEMRDECVACGQKIPNSGKYFIEHGNFCVRCCVMAERTSHGLMSREDADKEIRERWNANHPEDKMREVPIGGVRSGLMEFFRGVDGVGSAVGESMFES